MNDFKTNKIVFLNVFLTKPDFYSKVFNKLTSSYLFSIKYTEMFQFYGKTRVFSVTKPVLDFDCIELVSNRWKHCVKNCPMRATLGHHNKINIKF